MMPRGSSLMWMLIEDYKKARSKKDKLYIGKIMSNYALYHQNTWQNSVNTQEDYNIVFGAIDAYMDDAMKKKGY